MSVLKIDTVLLLNKSSYKFQPYARRTGYRKAYGLSQGARVIARRTGYRKEIQSAREVKATLELWHWSKLQRSLLVEMFQGKDWPIFFYRNLPRFKGRLCRFESFQSRKMCVKKHITTKKEKINPYALKLLIYNYHASFSEKIRMRYSL